MYSLQYEDITKCHIVISKIRPQLFNTLQKKIKVEIGFYRICFFSLFALYFFIKKTHLNMKTF